MVDQPGLAQQNGSPENGPGIGPGIGLDSAAAFLSQLSVSPYIADMRSPTRAKPAARAARPPLGREPSPGVLLISRARDGEFGALANLLGRVGISVGRVNADELDDADLLLDPARRAVRVNGRWLRPTVTWLRHFSSQAIERHGAAAHDLFLRESWDATAGQLAGLSATSIRSQRPGMLAQLELAERHGIAAPRTVVTTDPYHAKEVLHGPRLVIKALHRHFVEPTPGSLTGVFPAIAARGDLVPLPRPGPPVIVQEYVEHDAELRVYCVAGQVQGFQIVKDAPADLWLRGDRVLVRAVEPAPNVIRAARLLASALSLRYCAFDFLVRDGGPVFLEMDPNGDWLWVESKAGVVSVTMAVARMLCGAHRAHRPAAISGSGPPAESFNLLAFLTDRGASR